jgi:hypothetical protein
MGLDQVLDIGKLILGYYAVWTVGDIARRWWRVQ